MAMQDLMKIPYLIESPYLTDRQARQTLPGQTWQVEFLPMWRDLEVLEVQTHNHRLDQQQRCPIRHRFLAADALHSVFLRSPVVPSTELSLCLPLLNARLATALFCPNAFLVGMPVSVSYWTATLQASLPSNSPARSARRFL